MKSLVNPRFLKAFGSLRPEVQLRARKAYRLWKVNPRHPSLHFKKTGKVWSVRVDEAHRALGNMLEDTMIWFWIGSHDDYERLIRTATHVSRSASEEPEE